MTPPKQIIELCETYVFAISWKAVLCQGQNAINEKSSFKYRDLLHDRSNDKVIREIFQVYNNTH